MVKFRIILSLLSVFPQVLFAANLSEVRQQPGRDLSQITTLVRERVTRLRTLLETQDLVFSELAASDGPFKQRATFQRTHEVKAAEYFKRTLLKAAEQLRLEERYATPPVFNPADFGHEIDEKVASRRRTFIESVLGNNFDEMVIQLQAQLAHGGYTAPRAIPTNAGDNIVARTHAAAKFIRDHQPKSEKDIETILGRLYRVDVFDDVTTKLRFTTVSDEPVGSLRGLKDTEEISLSLSMLIYIRTELDNYLVLVLGYVTDKLTRKQKDLADEKTEIEKSGVWPWENSRYEQVQSELSALEPVLKHVQEQTEGAQWANQVVNRLTPDQMDFLIDLMLQVRGEDVPLADDVQPLAVLAQADADRNMNDYQFYKNMHDELYALENYLDAENRMKEQVKKIISDIKEGK